MKYLVIGAGGTGGNSPIYPQWLPAVRIMILMLAIFLTAGGEQVDWQ